MINNTRNIIVIIPFKKAAATYIVRIATVDREIFIKIFRQQPFPMKIKHAKYLRNIR